MFYFILVVDFLYNLFFKALENSELNLANDLHVRLILDFPSEVSQWMVGIKKLIHELIDLKKKNEVKQNDQEEEEANSQ